MATRWLSSREARRDARGGAGTISQARMRARAHAEIAGDFLELGELQGGQLCETSHLTHAWPRFSSAAGRLGAMPAVAEGAISRARASAHEGARAP